MTQNNRTTLAVTDETAELVRRAKAMTSIGTHDAVVQQAMLHWLQSAEFDRMSGGMGLDE